MKLHILGAAQTVTGSMYLLEHNGRKLLLECGMFQGKRDETYQVNLNFPFKPAEIDAMILSHAHIDHSGNIPNLVRQGYQGWIYATNASADLADIMLRDSGHIQESDLQYVNKKRRNKGQAPMEPLYTQRDAIEAMPQFRSVWYKQAFEPIPGVTAHLFDAGHILGSSAVALDYQENGQSKRFWFSGDIGRLDAPILQDPVLPEKANTLLMECTYGDKKHERLEDAYDEFVDAINRTVRRGGKVIVPAFAVGRTQNLSYLLSEAIDNGDIPDVPVVIDSPLAANASDLYRKHTECFDDETWKYIAEHRMQGLDFDNLIFTRSVDESKALNEYKGPMVIISASGMAESGRIQHHLANNIEDGRNTILIISWQAPDTLGRRLADQERRVRIFGDEYYRKAEVVTIGGLSAHAGQDLLVQYALASKDTLQQLILVHGEEKAASALMEKLAEHPELPKPAYPVKGAEFEL
ncbi:MAG TPA: MBL fold metallo-hydrolase [Anaerolineaceae bacterium]|jgi:metallo-beta-lactamase family protein|nr:MBL fold metallo-hydrolase [Anaerolineaceae bacterium]HPS32756.1 MBL fold metallo-hydrolase [Anaerolineaceae bacterium]